MHIQLQSNMNPNSIHQNQNFNQSFNNSYWKNRNQPVVEFTNEEQFNKEIRYSLDTKNQSKIFLIKFFFKFLFFIFSI